MTEVNSNQINNTIDSKIQKKPSFYTVKLANRLVDIILKWQDKQANNNSLSSTIDWDTISIELNSTLKESRSNPLLPMDFKGEITPILCHQLWKFIAYNQIVNDDDVDYSSDFEEFCTQPMTAIRKYKYSNTNTNTSDNNTINNQPSTSDQQQQQEVQEVQEEKKEIEEMQEVVDVAKMQAIQSSKEVWTAARNSVVLEVSPGIFNGLPYVPLVTTQTKVSRMPHNVRVSTTSMGVIRMFGKPPSSKKGKPTNSTSTTSSNGKKGIKAKGTKRSHKKRDQPLVEGGEVEKERDRVSIKALKREFQDKKKAIASSSN